MKIAFWFFIAAFVMVTSSLLSSSQVPLDIGRVLFFVAIVATIISMVKSLAEAILSRSLITSRF